MRGTTANVLSVVCAGALWACAPATADSTQTHAKLRPRASNAGSGGATAGVGAGTGAAEVRGGLPVAGEASSVARGGPSAPAVAIAALEPLGQRVDPAGVGAAGTGGAAVAGAGTHPAASPAAGHGSGAAAAGASGAAVTGAAGAADQKGAAEAELATLCGLIDSAMGSRSGGLPGPRTDRRALIAAAACDALGTGADSGAAGTGGAAPASSAGAGTGATGPAAGSGAVDPHDATALAADAVVRGAAVFTRTAQGVRLVLVLDGCSDGKLYPVRIHAGGRCDDDTTVGPAWDRPRGEDIPDLRCTGSRASQDYERFDTQQKPWSIGWPPESNLVGRLVVVGDPDDRTRPLACGAITPP